MATNSFFVSGLIAGAAVGTVAGLMVAPKPGKVTRRFVAMQARRKTNRYLVFLRQKMGREETTGVEVHSDNHVGVHR